MAFKMSTGLRNALMGTKITMTEITLSTTATDTISDSGNALLTNGFRAGDTILTSGWTDGANNGHCTITSIASNGASMVISGLTLTTEGAGDSVTIAVVGNGKSFKDAFRNNVIRVYSGTEPADADADEGAGTLLLVISKASGVVTAGTATNGNNFDAIAAGVLTKDSEVWSDVGLSTGTASWWRMYDNGIITGSSSTAIRCQGTVGTSGVTFILSSTSITSGATTTLDTCTFTMPAS